MLLLDNEHRLLFDIIHILDISATTFELQTSRCGQKKEKQIVSVVVGF